LKNTLIVDERSGLTEHRERNTIPDYRCDTNQTLFP